MHLLLILKPFHTFQTILSKKFYYLIIYVKNIKKKSMTLANNFKQKNLSKTKNKLIYKGNFK